MPTRLAAAILLALCPIWATPAGACETGSSAGDPDWYRAAKAAIERGACTEALTAIDKAHTASDPQAARILAQLHQSGRCIPRDPAKAAEYYRAAALAGDPPAHAALGSLYLEGRGVPPDSTCANLWFRRLALLLARLVPQQERRRAVASWLRPRAVPPALLSVRPGTL